jgi:hypothetical protein
MLQNAKDKVKDIENETYKTKELIKDYENKIINLERNIPKLEKEKNSLEL